MSSGTIAARAPDAPKDLRPDALALSFPELTALMERLGERKYRAAQVFQWLHRRYAASFEEMTDLPKALRDRLSQELRLQPPAIDQVQQSSDGTRKYRLRTTDGRFVEAVYMPDEAAGRRTLCVSSQVGCAMGCTFCLTATMGLVRQMTTGEIVGEVHVVNRDLMENVGLPGPRPLTNLVFMGMGEPLHNFDHLKAALETLLSGEGPNFSHRHVTVSTSGLVPGIERLGSETEVKLAISLNATTDEVRDELMPVNRKWPIADLMAACRKFPLRQGRRITFEYVLLAGVNDSDEDAHRLARLVGDLPAKVNLIPYNENPGLGFREPSPERVESFRRILDDHHVAAPVRKNRGRDISAACGQLAVAGQGRDRSPRKPALPVTEPAA
jgi:23S rRNA (adenine2503-C2)-methyltransferase